MHEIQSSSRELYVSESELQACGALRDDHGISQCPLCPGCSTQGTELESTVPVMASHRSLQRTAGKYSHNWTKIEGRDESIAQNCSKNRHHVRVYSIPVKWEELGESKPLTRKEIINRCQPQ